MNTRLAVVAAPAMRLAGVTAPALPNVDGVKVTAGGRVEEPDVASSIFTSVLRVVYIATKTPLEPAYFWFVTEGMVMVTCVPVAISEPPDLVIVTTLPEVLAESVPSHPETAVASVAAMPAKVVGNSNTIFPSAGRGLPVVKTRLALPATPATRLAGVTAARFRGSRETN